MLRVHGAAVGAASGAPGLSPPAAGDDDRPGGTLGDHVSITRVGLRETKGYADGYDAIFGKKGAKKVPTAAAKKPAAPAKKKTAPAKKPAAKKK